MHGSMVLKSEKTTAAGFEPARAEPIGFQVQHLNHSVTLSYARTYTSKESVLHLVLGTCR